MHETALHMCMCMSVSLFVSGQLRAENPEISTYASDEIVIIMRQ